MSLWSDIQDKNGMIDIRKEDDVDVLDAQGFLDYLKENYIVQDSNMFSQIGSWEAFDNPNYLNISIPIAEEQSSLCSLTIRINKQTNEIISLNVGLTVISSSNRKITKKDCVSELDKRLKEVKTPLVLKKKNS